MRDLDESGVYTFESAETVPIESWEYEPSVHSEIDETLPPRREVLEAIVTSRELASGQNLDGAIARISREIDELKEHITDARVGGLEEKLEGLKRDTRTRVYRREPMAPAQTPAPVPALVDTALESRLASLEQKVGVGATPVALTTLLTQLRQKVDLLSTQPEKIQESAAALKSVQNSVMPDKVEAVYQRLENLGPLLDSLPQVVQRLKTLELLHIDAAASQSFLKDAEGTLRQIQTDIERWNKRLDRIEGALEGSSADVDQSGESLVEKRVNIE